MFAFFKRLVSAKPECPRGRGGGGGTLIFSAYVGSDPASTVHPKKISGISSTPKKNWNFSNPQKISQFCTLTLKKTLKCIEKTLKLAHFCVDPQKISTKSSYPKKILFFLKTPKNMKFRILNPKKWSEPTYVCKYQSTPPPPLGGSLFFSACVGSCPASNFDPPKYQEFQAPKKYFTRVYVYMKISDTPPPPPLGSVLA